MVKESSMKVKPSDLDPDHINTIIYDPGAGTLPTGTIFLGWTTEENYTESTTPMTIEGVRDAIRTRLGQPVTDGDEFDVYAMLFKQYNVTYLDENDTSLGVQTILFRADTTDTWKNYTVNQSYSPADNDHDFEGWSVKSGGDKIQGYTAGTTYENETEISISGDVVFSVVAPEGHWLIFNENGKGATYNAPQFVKTGQTTTKPCEDEAMTRLGYEFEGWYNGTVDSTGKVVLTTPFDFGGTLTDHTTIYAKWKSKAQATYTVPVWKQNVNGTDSEGEKLYDFVESVTVENATVDSTPNAVNERTGRVNGGTYNGETGFHYASTDQASKTVAPEGNTVVNVYWDRNEITFNFNLFKETYTPTTSTERGVQYYGLVGGESFEMW